MNEQQVKEILADPKKMLNLLRLVHQLLHLYDEKEMKEMIKSKPTGTEVTGLGDNLSIVLTDKDGKIKENINQKGG